MRPASSPPAARRPPSLPGFFVAAAVMAGLGFLPMVWASHRGAGSVPAAVLPLQMLMLFGPALLAIVWAAREGGRGAVRELLRGVVRWRVAPAWYAAALLGPALLDVLALATARALGPSHAALPAPGTVLPAFAASLGGYLLLNTEELAWRGYAWPRLRDRVGALRGSVLLGLVWGALHAPLFLMRGGHPGGWPPLLFAAMTVVFSVLFALAYEGTGGSLLVAHLLHQALNAWGDAIPIYPRVAGDAVPATLAVLLAAVVAVAGVRRAGWRWGPADAGASRPARAAAA